MVEPIGSEACHSDITSVSVSTSASHVAWTEREGRLTIKPLAGEEAAIVELGGKANCSAYLDPGVFIVGMDEGGLRAFDVAGTELWTSAAPGGVERMAASTSGDLIAIIDGTGILRAFNMQGRTLGEFSAGELIGVAVNSKGSAIACYDDEGQLGVLDRVCSPSFTRPVDSAHGERIITTAYAPNGVLLVSRETMDIPLGDSEQHEVEWWNPMGQKTHRVGLPARCDVLASDVGTTWAGLFDGRLLQVGEGGAEEIWRSKYAIHGLYPLGDDVLVASWFQLFRIHPSADEPVWQFEHAGIIDHVDIDSGQRVVALAGDDRNDYTETCPLMLLHPHSTPVWTDESSEEFEASAISEGETVVNAEELYADAGTDMLEFLSESEQQVAAEDTELESGEMDDLMAAFVEEASSDPVEATPASSPESLIENLMSEDAVHNQPPVCNAGEDQSIAIGEDGTATVMLDGSDSFDPDGEILRWTWVADDGRAVAKGPKVRLRLPRGNHRFTLTVIDDDGASTSDSITISIS